MTETAHTLSWMPFQSRVIFDDEHREILLSGAYGSAKTRTLCGRAIRKAQHPGARICITRKTHTSLIATTVRTLLEPDGDLPPVLPGGTYVYKEQKGRLFLNGGGEMVFCGCDNHLRLGSEQFSDVMIDEGIETEESEYVMLLGRMRVQYSMPDGSPNIRSIATATNPGSPVHYLYKRFYKEKVADRLCLESNTQENYYLPDDYRDSLSKLQGVFRQRYFLGMWVAFEGAIYPMWSEDIHCIRRQGPWDYFVAGVDVGTAHPSVIRVHGCRNGSVASHVVAEFHEAGVISPRFVDYCVETAAHYNPIVFVIDSAAADVSKQMSERGLMVVLADKDVLPGIRGIQSDLSYSPVQQPLLTMDPTCEKGNQEYGFYRWKEGREEPEKEQDDALDSDRYARQYIRAGYGAGGGLVMLGDATGEEVQSIGRIRQDFDAAGNVAKFNYELNIDDNRFWDDNSIPGGLA